MAHSSQVNDLGESSGPHARKRARNRKKLTQAYLATFWMQRAASRSHFNTKTKYLNPNCLAASAVARMLQRSVMAVTRTALSAKRQTRPQIYQPISPS